MMKMDNDALNATMQSWWQQNQEIFNSFTQSLGQQSPVQQALNEQNSKDFTTWLQALSQQPETLIKNQTNWWQQQLQIMQNAMQAGDENVAPVISEERGDRRFKGEQWQQNPWLTV